jgi:hypothetical protein
MGYIFSLAATSGAVNSIRLCGTPGGGWNWTRGRKAPIGK